MQFFVQSIEYGGYSAPLRCYLPDAAPRNTYAGRRPAVIIFPGGGYHHTYAGEAEPIALEFVAAGICAFVLDYSCAPVRFPVQLCQGLLAVDYVRTHAEEFGINAGNIATLGFSAGGHLCSSTGTLWNKPCMDGLLPKEGAAYRPDKLILCYPVIKAYGPHHEGSFVNLLGDRIGDDQMRRTVSTDLQVDDETPPAFLWHTASDNGVPDQSSLEFALALANRKIPHELHIYPHGGHGLCLGNHVTEVTPYGQDHIVAEWIKKAIRFAYDEEILKK